MRGSSSSQGVDVSSFPFPSAYLEDYDENGINDVHRDRDRDSFPYPGEAAVDHHRQYSPFLEDMEIRVALARAEERNLNSQQSTELLVRNIASFMTLNDDAANIMSTAGTGIGGGFNGDSLNYADDDNDSWAVGMGVGTGDVSLWSSVATPPTPGLVAISPGATPATTSTPHLDNRWVTSDRYNGGSSEEENLYMEKLLLKRRRKWAQEKLASAVFAHPQPLRSFCVDAYQAAQDIREQQQRKFYHEWGDPETDIEPGKEYERLKLLQRKERRQIKLLQDIFGFIFFPNVALSVAVEAVEASWNVSSETSVATFHISISVVNGTISGIICTTRTVWDGITNFNPFHLIEALLSFQLNAMGKTSEVLVSGIQSVTTGVESASSIALHRLSAANLSLSNRAGSATTVGIGENNAKTGQASRKLVHKMSAINKAARVVAYHEHRDDSGGLTRQAISRTRRMMHYSVSLRPFVATVAVKPVRVESRREKFPIVERRGIQSVDLDQRIQSNISTVLKSGTNHSSTLPAPYSDSSRDLQSPIDVSDQSGCSSAAGDNSPVICSPQSFPPTPRSRQMVLARGSQFADDVVFLARDRLRIHDGLASHNERTREMAWALKEGKRLAIFDANGVNGIELTCGQHIAAKVGSMHYASTRSMVPILRNCYVYFEVTVLPRHHADLQMQNAPATLSIGLSTLEMPPNTQLGSWPGSIGLSTTGQILLSGQWCSFEDPSAGAYGYGATVGCLVFLNDSSSFETWDGVMVNASVTFSVNGVVIPSPVSTHSSTQSAQNDATDPGRTLAPDQSSSTAASLVQSVSTNDSRSPPIQSSLTKRAVSLLVPSSEELYPTVTLQTLSTAVMCRFSSEDVVMMCGNNGKPCSDSDTSYGCGMSIPLGATVYAVDGSVIRCPDATVESLFATASNDPSKLESCRPDTATIL